MKHKKFNGTDQANEETCYEEKVTSYLDEGDGKDLPFPHPPRGWGNEVHELPLSNKLISVRAERKKGVKGTTGSIKIFPSMLVRKRDYSQAEQDYYDMIARYGQKSRQSGSIRGKIDHFSDAARFRMLKQLGSIGREDPPHMCTLTYRSGSANFEQSKKDLRKFSKRLDREFGISHKTTEPYIRKDGLPDLRTRIKYEPQWAGVWRFEVTTGRGTRAKGATPHFHILVWCDEWHELDPYELDHRISNIWCEVTKDGGEDRMRYGCDIKASHGDQTKLKNYMLGHHGKKTDQEAVGAGKHWGMMNKHLLNVGQTTAEYELTADQRNKYDRITRQIIARRTGTEARDINDLRETHTVLSPWETSRLLDYLQASKVSG